MKVTFLFDKTNNWIKEYIIDFDYPKKFPFNFNFKYSYKSISNQDIVFILGYTKVLPRSFIQKNKLNLVCHESDLPKGKGYSPVQWQILEGRKKIPIKLININENIDAGDILCSDHFILRGHELYSDIRKLQATATNKLINKFLLRYPKVRAIKQIGKSTYYRKRSKLDSELDVKKTIKDQFNLLRIVNNDKWPAYFRYKKRKYILKVTEEK